jgi:2,5-furandicarboxylate decarboxylase 1
MACVEANRSRETAEKVFNLFPMIGTARGEKIENSFIKKECSKMQKGMREFLEILEKNGELRKLSRPVNPLAVSAIIAKSEPAVLMPVEGYDIPVVGALVRNRKRVALALNCEVKDLSKKLLDSMQRRIEPVMVKEAPCQEVVMTGKEVDLTCLPIIFQHEQDGGPYIGSAVQLVRWKNYGLNAGMYRHMFRTINTMGIDLNSPSDLRLFYSQAHAQGKPLEIASAIGLYPTELVAATYTAPTGVNEMAIAGALRGEPVEMVKCRTIDVEVPANAEIVLECEIQPEGWIGDEGRYGEFHQVAGNVKHNPIVKVKAITHRRNPIFYSLLMPDEVYGLVGPLREAIAWRILETARLRPTAIRAPIGGCSLFELIVALDHPNPGEGKAALMALMSLMGVKLVIVVDENIDIYDDEEIRWAMALRVQADQDVVIVSNVQAKHMDPTVRHHLLPPGRLPVTSKMGIDATIPPDIDRRLYDKAKIFRRDEVEIPE